MGLFGGGGSTQTSTTSNVPFNADALRTVENNALDLGQTNPLQYYPGQTYAPPDAYFQTGALNNIGNFAMNAGNQIAPQMPQLQQEAINPYEGVAQGSNINALGPILNAINGMANTNAAQIADPLIHRASFRDWWWSASRSWRANSRSRYTGCQSAVL